MILNVIRTIEREWMNKASLVGLFEINWKTSHHSLFVKFLNTWKDHKGEYIFVHVGEKVMILDVHIIEKIFKMNSKGWRGKIGG